MTNEQLVARIQAHENEAENMLELWQQNKGFIYKMAVKYGNFAELEDLLQEGYIGLCYAVQHYKDDQEASFIHYAAFWIKQTMQRYISNCCNIVRIPEGVRSDVIQYKKTFGEYKKRYGRNPTDAEMRTLLGVSWERLETIQKCVATAKVSSLSESIGDDGDITLGDTVASDQELEEDVIRKLDTAAMKKSLWKAVDDLPEELPEVIRCRYKDNMTLKKTGEKLGVTTERARQIENKALRKLRIPSKCAPFKCYFEQYIAAAPVRHVGVAQFERTWMSATELQVLCNMGYE